MQTLARMVSECQVEDDPWSLGNAVLYDLCRVHSQHLSVREVVAKVWLIGRAYSAAVERGRGIAAGPDLSNDSFYTEALAPALIESQLDQRLQSLQTLEHVTVDAVAPILSAHGYLVSELAKITGKNKRSFASKYLHFHRPSLFFIYDSRAANAVRSLGIRRTRVAHSAGVDAEYAGFVQTVLSLRAEVADQFGVTLTPRQLDRLLLHVKSS